MLTHRLGSQNSQRQRTYWTYRARDDGSGLRTILNQLTKGIPCIEFASLSACHLKLREIAGHKRIYYMHAASPGCEAAKGISVGLLWQSHFSHLKASAHARTSSCAINDLAVPSCWKFASKQISRSPQTFWIINEEFSCMKQLHVHLRYALTHTLASYRWTPSKGKQCSCKKRNCGSTCRQTRCTPLPMQSYNQVQITDHMSTHKNENFLLLWIHRFRPLGLSLLAHFLSLCETAYFSDKQASFLGSLSCINGF